MTLTKTQQRRTDWLECEIERLEKRVQELTILQQADAELAAARYKRIVELEAELESHAIINHLPTDRCVHCNRKLVSDTGKLTGDCKFCR